jgi:uncharacterized protein involved in oxidation of intracellular sulfur
MKILFIINDAPYGSEKTYNALRLVSALQIAKSYGKVVIFLMSDAVSCGVIHQSTPQGYYNIESMLKAAIKKGAKVKACTTCLKARGMYELKMIEGVEAGGMSDLATWVQESDKIVTF